MQPSTLNYGLAAPPILPLGAMVAFLLLACRGPAPPDHSRPLIAATIHPLGMILRELAGDRAEVRVLLPSGASPHTYDPRPSDTRATEQAAALFFVSGTLDGWGARLPAKRRIEVFNGLPPESRLPISPDHADHPDPASEQSHSDHFDPHVWTDPLTVKALLPRLAADLAELDPHGAPTYRRNAEDFSRRLDALNEQAQDLLKEFHDAPVFLFHPSFRYLLRRYGLRLAAVIEPFPGREPSPRYLQSIVEQLRKEQARAVFSEPQLPPRPAQVIAEAAGVKLFELDPNGGIPGRETYADWLLYNVRILREALR